MGKTGKNHPDRNGPHSRVRNVVSTPPASKVLAVRPSMLLNCSLSTLLKANPSPHKNSQLPFLLLPYTSLHVVAKLIFLKEKLSNPLCQKHQHVRAAFCSMSLTSVGSQGTFLFRVPLSNLSCSMSRALNLHLPFKMPQYPNTGHSPLPSVYDTQRWPQYIFHYCIEAKIISLCFF